MGGETKSWRAGEDTIKIHFDYDKSGENYYGPISIEINDIFYRIDDEEMVYFWLDLLKIVSEQFDLIQKEKIHSAISKLRTFTSNRQRGYAASRESNRYVEKAI